jgi:hypothetical protein
MHFAGKEQLDIYAVNPVHLAAGAELNRVFCNIIDFDILYRRSILCSLKVLDRQIEIVSQPEWSRGKA